MNMTLRHALATLAYRSAKTIREMPSISASFQATPGTRTPLEILAHMGDLLDWALAMANGKPAWKDSKPLEWTAEVDRYFAALQALDARFASAEPIACDPNKLFQGPLADALTHTGQIAILRRMAGAPVKGENYYMARIEEGVVGSAQNPPVREF
jgi:hypothetical protein